MKKEEACKILGVGIHATSAEIRSTFRKKALECHSDKKDDVQYAQRWHLLLSAYETLTKPEQKAIRFPLAIEYQHTHSPMQEIPLWWNNREAVYQRRSALINIIRFINLYTQAMTEAGSHLLLRSAQFSGIMSPLALASTGILYYQAFQSVQNNVGHGTSHLERKGDDDADLSSIADSDIKMGQQRGSALSYLNDRIMPAPSQPFEFSYYLGYGTSHLESKFPSSASVERKRHDDADLSSLRDSDIKMEWQRGSAFSYQNEFKDGIMRFALYTIITDFMGRGPAVSLGTTFAEFAENEQQPPVEDSPNDVEYRRLRGDAPVPPEFAHLVCPVLQQIFTTPCRPSVINAAGERIIDRRVGAIEWSAIERWAQTSNQYPLNRQEFKIDDLIMDDDLAREAEHFVESVASASTDIFSQVRQRLVTVSTALDRIIRQAHLVLLLYKFSPNFAKLYMLILGARILSNSSQYHLNIDFLNKVWRIIKKHELSIRHYTLAVVCLYQSYEISPYLSMLFTLQLGAQIYSDLHLNSVRARTEEAKGEDSIHTRRAEPVSSHSSTGHVNLWSNNRVPHRPRANSCWEIFLEAVGWTPRPSMR